MIYSVIGKVSQSPTAKKIHKIQSSIIDTFGGGTVMQLPLHVTLLRFEMEASLNLEMKIQENLRKDNINSPVTITKCEKLSDAGVIWMRLKEERVVSDLAKKSVATIESTINPINMFSTSISNSPHITIAYRDYNKFQIEEIFKKIDQINFQFPMKLKIDELLLCKKDVIGLWSVV